jgi:hypothetical protein
MTTAALDHASFDGYISSHELVVVGFLGRAGRDEAAQDEAAFAVAVAAAQAAQPQAAFATVDAAQGELLQMFGVEGSAVAIFRERVVLFFEPGIPAAARLTEVLQRAAALDMARVHAELEQQHATESALATHRVCPTARRGSFS